MRNTRWLRFGKVRANDSLRPQFETIFNQCDVLLVSYFGATTQDIFRACLPDRVSRSRDRKFLKQDLKITFADLQENDFDLTIRFADLFIDSRDISFQDMASINRAFAEFIGYDPPRSDHVRNIVLAQACRHAIVHSGGVVDSRLVRQVSEATPRQVKSRIQEGEQIQFRPDEIEQVGASMLRYVDDLVDGVQRRLSEVEN
jgi:hypothetical protein